MIKPGNRDPSRTSDDQSWRACTAEGARQDVQDLFAHMSFREKVTWLEEAEAVAQRFRIKISHSSTPGKRPAGHS